MKLLNRNILTFCVLALLMTGCSKNNDVLLNKNNDEYYKFIYLKDTIIMVHGNLSQKNEAEDSTFYYKNGNDYFENVYDPTTGPKAIKKRISFSVDKETSYNYNVLGKLFYCRISKTSNKSFKTVYANCDSLEYKYKRILFYDKNYKVFEIEAIDNNQKIIFEKE